MDERNDFNKEMALPSHPLSVGVKSRHNNENFTRSVKKGISNFPTQRQTSELKYNKKNLAENIENTIFIGNLPKEISHKELKKLFRKFGPISSLRFRCAIRKELKTPKKLAIIKKDFHEESNHINAFIKFNEFESCKDALKMNGELYKGHHLRITLAKDSGKSDSRKSVFIGNLSFKAQDDDLWNAFEDCGSIESVRVIRDVKTGIGKGFGYVNFKSADSVELALKLNGVSVLDRNIRVTRVANDLKPNKERKMKVPKKKNMTEIKEKVSKPKDGNKTSGTIKMRKEYQGQKTKPSKHKKFKKKKKLDKKKMIIKQIAEGLKKRKENKK